METAMASRVWRVPHLMASSRTAHPLHHPTVVWRTRVSIERRWASKMRQTINPVTLNSLSRNLIYLAKGLHKQQINCCIRAGVNVCPVPPISVPVSQWEKCLLITFLVSLQLAHSTCLHHLVVFFISSLYLRFCRSLHISPHSTLTHHWRLSSLATISLTHTPHFSRQVILIL